MKIVAKQFNTEDDIDFVMTKTRMVLSWVIFITAALVMVIPLSDKDESHLMSEAEANDNTLVILTTETGDFLQPIVDQFADSMGVNVHLEAIAADALASDTVRDHQADLVLVHHLDDMVPLITDAALDTLPPDIMWNVHEQFRDPSERWVGFTGRLENDSFTVSGVAMTQRANSKPLAERFIIYLYSRAVQQELVEQSGQYSFLAFGVDAPAGLPELSTLNTPPFGDYYDSTNLTAKRSTDLAAAKN